MRRGGREFGKKSTLKEEGEEPQSLEIENLPLFGDGTIIFKQC